MKINWKVNNYTKYLYMLDNGFCYTTAKQYFKYNGTYDKSPAVNKVYKIIKSTEKDLGCGPVYEIEHKGKNYFVAKDYKTEKHYYRYATQKEIEEYENSI